jgi:hypothetical protein
MRAMPYLQIVNGKYRVRIVVPPELRPYLPPPYTGKANLTRALGTANERRSLPVGGLLFPNVPLDTYGKRASKVTTECSTWLRNVVKITDPNKPFYSHRHTATSYLRNTRLPDGSPPVKEDIERYILGHAGKGAHARYGKRWFETVKAAVEVIPNPLDDSVSKERIRQ